MIRIRTLAPPAVALAALLTTPALAWAAEGGGDAPDAGKLLGVLLAVVLGLLACVGIGATVLLLRIMLPGIAGAADDAIARLSTKRLILGGVLPIVGAALVAQGIGTTQSETLGAIFLLLVGLPMVIALLVGAMAALPRIGAGALRGGERASPFARCAVGGLVLGLSLVSWALPPLGALVSLLLLGWFFGAGVGAAIRRSGPTTAPRMADAPTDDLPTDDLSTDDLSTDDLSTG